MSAEMSKHTPGPWKLRMIGGWPMIMSSKIDVDPDTGISYPLPVADLHHGGYGNIYDAHLMAAAPDLLHALEFLVTCSAPMTPQQIGCWEIINKAIAKAKGETV